MEADLIQSNISYSNQKIYVQSIKQLMNRLTSEISQESYDINACVRFVIENMLNDQFIQNIQQHSTKSAQCDKKHIQDIKSEIVQISWTITNMPQIFIEMFQREEFLTQHSEINLNHYIRTKVYKKFIINCERNRLNYFVSVIEAKDNQISEGLRQRLLYILQLIANIMIRYYENGSAIIKKKVSIIEEIIKQIQIMNTYILYKILRDLSKDIKQNLLTLLRQGLFRQVQASCSEKFANFILQKHQILQLSFKQHNYPTQHQQDVQKILKGAEIQARLAIFPDQQGIFLLVHIPLKQSSFLLFLNEQNEDAFINTKILRRKWKISIKKLDLHNYKDCINFLKKNKQQQYAKLIKNQVFKPISRFALVQGNLGKSLTQINQYSQIQEFMVDISQRTLATTSLNTLMIQAPLVGYFFMAGSLSYTVYHIIKNKTTSGKRKFEQISSMAISTTSMIGSSIAGAIIGQSLIPIPFVGAVIGSVFGGFMGQKGGKKLSQHIDNKRFIEKIQYLKKTMKPQGYWQVNDKLLEKLRINNKEFSKRIPQNLKTKNLTKQQLWMALICFTMISFDETKRLKEFNKLKFASLDQEQDEDEQGEAILGQKINEEEKYVANIKLNNTIKLIQQQRCSYIKFIYELQEMVKPLISKK